MKFKIKAEENFDQEKWNIQQKLVYDFQDAIEKIAFRYAKHHKLGQNMILEALDQAVVFFDANDDLWFDWNHEFFDDYEV